MPAISIVIPTYNAASELYEALMSVKRQTFEDWEAIVVNNHSTDDTIEVIDRMCDPRIRRFNIKNDGVIAKSRNLGISEAKSRLIAFLDSDDTWIPEKLERSLQFMQSDGNTDLICHWEEYWQEGEIIKILRHGWRREVSYRALLYQGCMLSPSAVVVKKAWLEKVGGFREDKDLVTAEDYDLWLRLARAGCRMRFLPEILGRFRVTGKNESGKVGHHHRAVRKVISLHYDQLPNKTWRDTFEFKQRLAQIHYGAACSYLRIGNKKKAVKELPKMLGIYPFSPLTIPALIGWLSRGLFYPGERKSFR